MFARFVDGQLVELHNPVAGISHNSNVDRMIAASLEVRLPWFATAEGEIWGVVCFRHKLCEPERITPGDPASVQYVARKNAGAFAAGN